MFKHVPSNGIEPAETYLIKKVWIRIKSPVAKVITWDNESVSREFWFQFKNESCIFIVGLSYAKFLFLAETKGILASVEEFLLIFARDSGVLST